jgi:hypothetical protein
MKSEENEQKIRSNYMQATLFVATAHSTALVAQKIRSN